MVILGVVSGDQQLHLAAGVAQHLGQVVARDRTQQDRIRVRHSNETAATEKLRPRRTRRTASSAISLISVSLPSSQMKENKWH